MGKKLNICEKVNKQYKLAHNFLRPHLSSFTDKNVKSSPNYQIKHYINNSGPCSSIFFVNFELLFTW